jgi:hypothetical protein
LGSSTAGHPGLVGAGIALYLLGKESISVRRSGHRTEQRLDRDRQLDRLWEGLIDIDRSRCVT